MKKIFFLSIKIWSVNFASIKCFFYSKIKFLWILRSWSYFIVPYFLPKVYYIPFQLQSSQLVGEKVWYNSLVPNFIATFVFPNPAQSPFAFYLTNSTFYYLKYFSCILYYVFGTYYLNTNKCIFRDHLNYH